jgi:hypothetical protein
MFSTLQNFKNEVVVNQVKIYFKEEIKGLLKLEFIFKAPTTNRNVVIEAETLDKIEKGSAGNIKQSFMEKLFSKICKCKF